MPGRFSLQRTGVKDFELYLALLVVTLEAGEVQIPLQADFGKFHEAVDLKYYVDMVILGLKQQILEV